MSHSTVRIGSSTFHPPAGAVGWDRVELDGEPYMRVSNVDAMAPFFMNVASDSNFWLFAGSNGAFVGGRVDPEGALYPYGNVDSILERPDSGGARSVFLVAADDAWALWEPWMDGARAYTIERNLYKHIFGTSVVFEEINHDLKLRFQWELTTCEPYGLVRECRLENLSESAVSVRYLDGLHKVIPPGVSTAMMAGYSYLAAAYMRHDAVQGLPLGVYTLNALVLDTADPGESLRAAAAWSVGHKNPEILLSSTQIEEFRKGGRLTAELEVRGALGACLVADNATIQPGASHQWIHAADTQLDHAALAGLQAELKRPGELRKRLRSAVRDNRDQLRKRIASADGLQHCADDQMAVHHFANVLYNVMRGGTFVDGYRFPSRDFAAYLRERNSVLAGRLGGWLDGLAEELDLDGLRTAASVLKDPDLDRHVSEYLPLTFSRRHGDPSRPWNRFAIHLQDEEGHPRFAYEGNWRDIFQNWEGLSLSYPRWLPNMINVFLSATTAEGYNPYRVTRGGIDWEVPDPADPRSHIGYWGDHQIIYLLRLLETDADHHPGRLSGELTHRGYAYAEVPYLIGDLQALLDDPRHSIDFDQALNEDLQARASALGGDGKLLRTGDGRVGQVTLAEKLLVPMLTKLTNFAPGGGIWLNTQRPEWNDANNALAGWGLSMVTVCYMRRYVAFCRGLFAGSGEEAFELTEPVADLIHSIANVLTSGVGDYETFKRLGRAGEVHRAAVYNKPLAGAKKVSAATLDRLFSASLAAMDQSIRANRRGDGLYHGYNTLALKNGSLDIGTLDEMLEGQVAVLSSGCLDSSEVLNVLRAMRGSGLYREDQHSYLLYPDRDLAPFAERNHIDPETAERVPLLRTMLAEADRRLVTRDLHGMVHFQGDLRNAQDVETRLAEIGASQQDAEGVLALWEDVFNHRAFTGRSSTFFAFEGLGSIYWHMVAKLLLAVQECYQEAEGQDRAALAEAYDDVRAGLGFTKSPEVFGAIPTDPYSHSPRHMGAQQPGMTGQVKEEILTRRGELGVQTRHGRLAFEPTLLHRSEFAAEPTMFSYVNTAGSDEEIAVPAGGLAFTVCQVPVIYRLAESAGISVYYAGGEAVGADGAALSKEDSTHVFSRDGSITSLEVRIPQSALRS